MPEQMFKLQISLGYSVIAENRVSENIFVPFEISVFPVTTTLVNLIVDLIYGLWHKNFMSAGVY